jgi:transcriptional regulator with XRE-family HTH domain
VATKTPTKKGGSRNAPPLNAFQAVRVITINHEPKLELRERLKMTREGFGRLVNVSVRTIAAAELNKSDVAKLKRPYAEVGRLYRALSDLIDEEAIGPWFATPNDAFGGLKPMEVIERGEIDRLWNMVHRLQSGMAG